MPSKPHIQLQVHVDNNSIGWYQSTYLGTYCSKELIQTQYSHQQKNPDSVVIVFDPVSTAKGTLALKALRLTESFMKSYNPTHDGIDMYVLMTVCDGSAIDAAQLVDGAFGIDFPGAASPHSQLRFDQMLSVGCRLSE